MQRHQPFMGQGKFSNIMGNERKASGFFKCGSKINNLDQSMKNPCGVE